jgi:hypothetical protein
LGRPLAVSTNVTVRDKEKRFITLTPRSLAVNAEHIEFPAEKNPFILVKVSKQFVLATISTVDSKHM